MTRASTKRPLASGRNKERRYATNRAANRSNVGLDMTQLVISAPVASSTRATRHCKTMPR